MKHLSTLFGVLLASTPLLAQPEQPVNPNLRRAPTTPPPAVAKAVAALRTDRSSRISHDLQQLFQYSKNGGLTTSTGATTALRTAFPLLSVNGAGGSGSAAVLVRITARDVAALRPALESRGFVTVSEKSKLHFIEGELPVSQLAPGATGVSALAGQGLLGVTAVWRPLSNTGRVQNQADYVLESLRVRGAQAGYNGTGQRVGVMSDSYDAQGGAAAGVASGDLPADVLVLQDTPGEADEGRAMIELIHDIAPAAGAAFSSVYRGEADFADQMLRLADPTAGNCKILVDDITYFAEPMFQDGVVAQAVTEASSRLGVAFFSSAGNGGDASCEYAAPVFRPTGIAAGNAELDFGASFSAGGTSDTRQHYSVPKGFNLFPILEWSDPFYTVNGVKTDLDIYLIKTRANGVVLKGDTVASSADDNIGSQTPVEGFSYTNNNDTDTEFDLVITRFKGTADPARVKFILYGDNVAPAEYFTRSSTVTGHHAAIGVMSVAAAASFNRLAPEGFTSKGLPTYLFAPDGTPLATPEVRQKPDFTAIDGVSTTFFIGSPTPDPKDGYLFFGTSAAAPNAAAVAALMRQAQPSLTPAQVNERLKSTALDLGTPGFDDFTGSGLINAYRAIYGPVTAAAAPFTETFNTAGLAAAWDIQGRGAGRALVRNDFEPASTPGHLVLDSFFPYYRLGDPAPPRIAEATLRLDLSTAATGGYVLTFRHKKFTGEVDDAMPAKYSNNGDGSVSDGVALSVDGGTTWYRLADLTGTNATTTYQTVTVNLNTFATANSLTLGNDVRIRFQRSGANGAPGSGISAGQVDSSFPARRGGRAFDDVTVLGADVTQTPVAQFGATTSGALCPGSTVQYRDASLFAPTTYAWTFPGGTPSTSTAANPVVTYSTAGTYGATLTVTNASGSSSSTTANIVTISSVKPTANFTARQAPICSGGTVKFTNSSTNCASSYVWSFPGGTPATSTEVSPTVTFGTVGTYTVSLVAKNSNGDSAPKTFVVTVQGTALAIPYAENFATGIPGAWGVLNPDNGLTWTAATNTLLKDGTRGTAIAMPFFSYRAAGQRDSLQSPSFDLRNQTIANLRFDLAYAPIDQLGTNNDSLAVDVFTACTKTLLARVYLKSAATGLATTLPRNGTTYSPSATTQWRQENVSLGAYLGQQIYLRFTAYNRRGNNLYLSNVRVDNVAGLASRAQADSPGLLAYPNPVAGGARLTLELPQARGTASVRVLDALGRVSSLTRVELSPGASVRQTLASPLAAGLYPVLCQTANGQLYSRRVVVQ